MATGLIMAGGFGKRLWPESKLNHPKQFLAIKEKKSLIQLAYQRCINLFGAENTFIITRQELKEKILSHIPSVSSEQIIPEPVGRDTAACIGFGAIYIKRIRGDSPVVVLPSDHLIEDKGKFNEIMKAATKFAQKGYLVTVGIKPTRAETGYGYLQIANKIEDFNHISCYKLERFTEKPSQAKAKSFVESGNFLWNAGIFAWRPSVILKEIKKYLPPLHQGLEKIKMALGKDEEEETIKKVYPHLPKISIDYGVMEKTKKAVVIPAEFAWDDIGEWRALERVFPENQKGNIIQGLVKELGVEDCILVNREEKMLGVIGISNVIVVNCKGGLLLVNREFSFRVKELVDELLQDEKLRKYAE
ncbi:mannose-1-phosphate guanylyltransferase [Candidatus Aerophobetes bacterium]|nr:mannose-1-phosphate guanylyltransferase [Candidatus Aerophobetes bacterium]